MIIPFFVFASLGLLHLAKVAQLRIELNRLAHQTLYISGAGGPEKLQRRMQGMAAALDPKATCTRKHRRVTCLLFDNGVSISRDQKPFAQPIVVRGSAGQTRLMTINTSRFDMWPGGL